MSARADIDKFGRRWSDDKAYTIRERTNQHRCKSAFFEEMPTTSTAGLTRALSTASATIGWGVRDR